MISKVPNYLMETNFLINKVKIGASFYLLLVYMVPAWV
jgi:hypothetical protein